MKKFLRITAILVGGLMLILLISGIYINYTPIPSYPTEQVEFTVNSDSASVAEGARMASMLCVNCHMSEDGKLGGAFMADAADFGKIYSRNITSHPEYGIGDYSDGELAYLLRTGIKKDGQYSPPYMPKFPHLSDKDLNDIIAFLRSDHPWVQPSSINPPEPQPNFLTKMLARVAFKPLPYPQEKIATPPARDPVVFGKYLATAKFDCYGCHSQDFKTYNALQPELTPGFFGGGNVMANLEGQPIVTANLTMCEKTGIGQWSEEEFIKALKFGIKPDGPGLQYPMAPYSQMTDEEARAIYAYLQSLPVIENDVAMALRK